MNFFAVLRGELDIGKMAAVRLHGCRPCIPYQSQRRDRERQAPCHLSPVFQEHVLLLPASFCFFSLRPDVSKLKNWRAPCCAHARVSVQAVTRPAEYRPEPET